MVDSPSIVEALDATRALTFVHDPIAVPYLARAVRANPLVTPLVVTALEQIADDQAIRSLGSLLHEKRYPDGPMLARAALDRIQSTTLVASRKRLIQQLLSQQEDSQ